MCTYARDQLFHAICHYNDPTTIHFICFPRHKVEVTQVLNGLPYIIYEELLVNPKHFITRSGIGQGTMEVWDKDKRTFAKPNYLYNEEVVDSMFNCTGIMALDIDQDPQFTLKNQMGTFDEADHQRSYADAQVKYDETVTISSMPFQIRRKLQTLAKT